VGIGGCGCYSIDRILKAGLIKHLDINGIESIAINTDNRNLSSLEKVDKKVFLRLSEQYIEKTVWSSKDYCDVIDSIGNVIDGVLGDADVIILIAGLGGVTGSNISNVVADIATKKGIVVFSIFITPFSEESDRRIVAENAITNMKSITPYVVIFDNNKLLHAAPDALVSKAFEIFDSAVSEIINCVIESFEKTYLMPVTKIFEALEHDNDVDMEKEVEVRRSDCDFKDGKMVYREKTLFSFFTPSQQMFVSGYQPAPSIF
jgi:cell division protein FtsZ